MLGEQDLSDGHDKEERIKPVRGKGPAEKAGVTELRYVVLCSVTRGARWIASWENMLTCQMTNRPGINKGLSHEWRTAGHLKQKLCV